MTDAPERRAVVRTTHGDPDIAAAIAAAVRPDNTAEMETRVDGDAVETTITRTTTGGLHATVDDYVVNLSVAVQCTTDTTDTDTTHDT
jgi:hypothetical protein